MISDIVQSIVFSILAVVLGSLSWTTKDPAIIVLTLFAGVLGVSKFISSRWWRYSLKKGELLTAYLLAATALAVFLVMLLKSKFTFIN
jgi:glucose-6-phosphate-specific signal transduction histidine kinase